MSNLLKALAVPAAVLVASAVWAPWISPVREITDPPDGETGVPALLYRHERTEYRYTTADLRYPEAFGKPGQYAEAVAFDVLPWETESRYGNDDVAWVQLFVKELSGGPAPQRPEDVLQARRFAYAMTAEDMKRGTAKVFLLPEGSGYRAKSGLRALVALAVRIPVDLPASQKDVPQMFEEALADGFGQLRAAETRSVGIGRMIVRKTLGGQGARHTSWEMTLSAADRIARAKGMRGVVFGMWTRSDAVTARNRAAFRTAWQQHRQYLAQQSRTIAHELPRLAALIALAALVTWHLRKSELTWKRGVALALASFALAGTIMKIGQWSSKALEPAIPMLFSAECLAAIAAGAFIEVIVTFDYRKVIGSPRREDAHGSANS